MQNVRAQVTPVRAIASLEFASPFPGTLPIPLTGSQLTCYSSQVIMDGPIACSVQSSDPRIDIHFTNATLAGLKELFGTNMGRRA